MKLPMQDHVEGAVRPSQVQDDAAQAEEEHEDRDDLGRARDGPAPLGVSEAEDGRDEGPRVADADEEDEVRDVEAPVDGHVQARDGEAPAELRGPGEEPPEHDREEDAHEEPEARPRPRHREQQVRVLAESGLGAPFRLFHPIPLSTGRSPSARVPSSSRSRNARGLSREPHDGAPRVVEVPEDHRARPGTSRRRPARSRPPAEAGPRRPPCPWRAGAGDGRRCTSPRRPGRTETSGFSPSAIGSGHSGRVPVEVPHGVRAGGRAVAAADAARVDLGHEPFLVDLCRLHGADLRARGSIALHAGQAGPAGDRGASRARPP